MPYMMHGKKSTTKASLAEASEDDADNPHNNQIHLEADEVDEEPISQMEMASTVKEPEIPAVLLVDARNGFNELSQRTMLWTVCHLWTAG